LLIKVQKLQCEISVYVIKTKKKVHFLHSSFNLIIVSSTCFEYPSVHPQEDLYMQFYGISFVHPNKQPGRWQEKLCILLVLIDISQCTVRKT